MSDQAQHRAPTAPPSTLDAALAGAAELMVADAAEREAPPAGLWGRIEAALAAEAPSGANAPGTGTAPSPGSGGVIEYRIDAHDVVVSTGAGWDEFAGANEAPELCGAPQERTLWESIGDGSLRELWRSAVGAVRASGRPTTLPFRCDGPNARRWFEMTLVPDADGGVTFRSSLTFEMPRPELAALGRNAVVDTSASTVPVCSWCAEANDGDRWRPIEEVLMRTRLLEAETPPPVSHGICERCIAAMTERLHVEAEAQPSPGS